MLKNTLIFFIFIVSMNMLAQENSQEYPQEKQIKSVIEIFFKGLHKGDSTLMNSTLHKNIKIQTTSTNKQGKNILQTESKQELLTSIANKKPTDIYLEKLLAIDIKIDGNLASVWTPYEFYFNGNFSHCGANSFQLFDNNGKWEIIFLVDMRRTENCQQLKEKK
ncbi:MAG: hypothetical protein ACJA1B_001165 [Polaribacter sp.]|jgi:hypothetical protein